MLFLGLVARALRWRAAASLAVFVVAVLAVLSATVGPVYLAAANQLVFTERLAALPASQRDLIVSRDTHPTPAPVEWDVPVKSTAQVAASSPYFGDPVIAQRMSVDVLIQKHALFGSRLVTMDSMCTHLRFVSGRCPGVKPGEIVLSARTAATLKASIGDVVHTVSATEKVPIKLHVVGIYQPIAPHGQYWAAWDFFDQGPNLLGNDLPRMDTFFVSSTTLSGHVGSLLENITADVPLLLNRLQVDHEDDLRAAVAKTQGAASQVSAGDIYPTTVGTNLPSALHTIDHELSLTTTLVDLATVQLALLSICVLYALVSATATSHGTEVALAKLRGRRRTSVLAQGLLEPVALVLIAAPVGAVLGWLATRALSPHVLHGVTVGFPTQAFAVAAATAVAAAFAAGLAARRMLSTPIASLLRRGTDQATGSVGLLVADMCALTIAVAGLIQLRIGGVLTSGKPNPLSALAPTLLAVAVAVVGLRLLPLVARFGVRSSRESRRLVPFLASRQLLRRAGGTRLVLLTAIALALATLAVSTWSVGRINRQYRALNTVGADRVVTVTPKNDADFEDAVRRADPGGDAAMAVEILPVSSTPLLAVDTDRLPGIAAWRPDYSASSLADIVQSLRQQTPTVWVSGSALQLDLTVHMNASLPIQGSISIADPTHVINTLSLGALHPAQHTYRVALPSSCATARCRLAGLHFRLPSSYKLPVDQDTQLHPELQVRVNTFTEQAADGTSRAVDSGLSDATRWRSDDIGVATASSDDGAAVLKISPESAEILPRGTPAARYPQPHWPTLIPNDVPDHLPAVVATSTAELYPGDQRHDLSVVSLDGNPVALDGGITADSLPQLDRVGVMADLHMVQISMTAAEASGVQHQVWLSAHAPSEIMQRLKQQGLHIDGVRTAASEVAILDRTGPALADTIFLIAAIAATLLALGATVLGGLVTARRRSYELAALEAVGVAPRTLRRATAMEQALLIGLGVVLGVAAGIVGSMLAMPSTPIFVDSSVGPPVEYTLPAATLFMLCAALVVVLALICLVMARTVERQATALRLREAAP